jgi:hypothetical protein
MFLIEINDLLVRIKFLANIALFFAFHDNMKDLINDLNINVDHIEIAL